ncbi:MAG: hypothetical protein V4529_07090 [Gemmatimonadota bacterium]
MPEELLSLGDRVPDASCEALLEGLLARRAFSSFGPCLPELRDDASLYPESAPYPPSSRELLEDAFLPAWSRAWSRSRASSMVPCEPPMLDCLSCVEPVEAFIPPFELTFGLDLRELLFDSLGLLSCLSLPAIKDSSVIPRSCFSFAVKTGNACARLVL